MSQRPCSPCPPCSHLKSSEILQFTNLKTQPWQQSLCAAGQCTSRCSRHKSRKLNWKSFPHSGSCRSRSSDSLQRSSRHVRSVGEPGSAFWGYAGLHQRLLPPPEKTPAVFISQPHVGCDQSLPVRRSSIDPDLCVGAAYSTPVCMWRSSFNQKRQTFMLRETFQCCPQHTSSLFSLTPADRETKCLISGSAERKRKKVRRS